jgi:Endonuclease-reverse transcriptase
MCFSEHWLKNEEQIHFHFNGYNKVLFCRETFIHCGVGIFVKDEHKINAITVLNEFSEEKVFECIAAEIICYSNKYIVLCLYRSPEGNFKLFLDKLEKYLIKLISTRKSSNQVIICGDFNLNFASSSCDRKALDDRIGCFDIRITIHDSTRITKVSSTTIDNILTNVNQERTTTYVEEPGISDHKAQVLLVETRQASKVQEPVGAILEDKTGQRSAIGRASIELDVANSHKNGLSLYVTIKRNYRDVWDLSSRPRESRQISKQNESKSPNATPHASLFIHTKGFSNNDGVSCYANTALQAILNCNSLRSRLLGRVEKDAMYDLVVDYFEDRKHVLDSTAV